MVDIRERRVCWKQIVATSVFLMGLLWEGSFSMNVEGVVGSAATLNCYNGTADVETIHWRTNSSDTLSLVYFPKDNILQPIGHDPRFVISQNTQLTILELMSGDSDAYICTITSPVLEQELTFVAKLYALDGCVVWDYALPLGSDTCPPGVTVRYQHQCNFTCEAGSNLIGSNLSVCQSNGRLSGETPYCEDILCSIDALPPNLIGEGGSCRNGTTIKYTESCTFGCETGHSINGERVISCNEDGTLSGTLPYCTDITGGAGNLELLGLLAILPVIVVVFAVIWLLIRKRKEKRKYNDLQLETQRSLLAKESDDFPFLVTDQIKKLSMKEKRTVKLRIAKLMRNVEDKLLHDFPMDKNVTHGRCPENPTPEEAFAWYTYVIVSFIPLEDEADQVKRDILTATFPLQVQQPRDQQSVWSLMKPHIMKSQDFSKYLDVIHVAFATLLAVERGSILDEEEKRERTSAVSDALSWFHRSKKDEAKNTNVEEKDLPSDWKSSLGSGGQERGNTYFAEMCVKSINRCHNLSNALKLRHTILDIIYSDRIDTDAVLSRS